MDEKTNRSETSSRSSRNSDDEFEIDNESYSLQDQHEVHDPSARRKKLFIGSVTVLLLAVSWVGTQQFAQSAVKLAKFDAPYFATWIGTCWMALCFPIYGIFVVLKYGNMMQISEAFRDSARMFHSPTTQLDFRQFFLKVVPMNLLWLIANYLYIYGLKFIAATDASAIFASNVAFVYMLSICLIRERLYFIRICASLFCISGVVLFAYVEGFGEKSQQLFAGILMATGSAFSAALYKVVFKLWMGTANLGQVSLFLSLLGVSNILFMWTIFAVLYGTRVEYFQVKDIPWTELIASNLLGVVFNFTLNFGVTYTYPLFISVAMMLGIPLNAVVDVIIKDVTFSPLRLTAALLVVFGFVIMLFPVRWNDPIHRGLLCNSRNRSDTIEN